MFILQPFKGRVKLRTEGSVNYKRSAWLGHRTAPWEKERLWETACTLLCPCHHIYGLMLPLSFLGSLILMPLGQWDEGWLFLCEQSLHIPVVDYLWALWVKSRLLRFGGEWGEEGKRIYAAYGVHLLDNKTEWFI